MSITERRRASFVHLDPMVSLEGPRGGTELPSPTASPTVCGPRKAECFRKVLATEFLMGSGLPLRATWDPGIQKWGEKTMIICVLSDIQDLDSC